MRTENDRTYQTNKRVRIASFEFEGEMADIYRIAL